MSKGPLSWCEALEAEYRALYGAPALAEPEAAVPPTDPDARLHRVYARIHQQGPSALCLSGGGIRSATFALGVLQGLAHVGALGKFAYLSTVSGGGYIGGWLTAWLHRQGQDGREGVLRALDPAQAPSAAAFEDATSPVDRVRKTCRYLAPTGGAFSADLWTVIATLMRNLLLNWMVILPLVAAALLAPRLYFALVHAVEQPLRATPGPCLSAGTTAWWLLLAAGAQFAICLGYEVVSLAGRGGSWTQGRFLLWYLGPMVGGTIAITLFWSAYPCELPLGKIVAISALVPALGWGLVGVFVRRRARGDHASQDLRVRLGARTLLAALASGPILGLGMYGFAKFSYPFGSPLAVSYAVLAVPIGLGLVLLTIAVFVGFASGELDDAALEWWSRSGAWIAIALVVWAGAGGLVIYLTDVMDSGFKSLDAWLHLGTRTSATVFAGIIPLLSSLAGMAARSGGPNTKPSALRRAAQGVGLPAFIVLLLCSIAWVDLRVLEQLEYHRLGGTLCDPLMATEGSVCHEAGAGLGEIMLLGGLLVAIGLIMSRFVPANRFSLHGMYRQRIIRPFLGSSRPDRQPNAFTGFDVRDDLPIHELRDVRPLHVVNTTLNAVSSTEIGRHEKQSQSFTFSPLHVGNAELGYQPASAYGSDAGSRRAGVSMGTALAVSGAAASSAMGRFSSKSRAFLLTLANARLGLWFGNPQSATTWMNGEPPLGVGPLVRELLGLTTDKNPYVYLSDGGHYENLGLWEMVARRCRFIVVSDAGCDPDYAMSDLANAVRRIRLDLGVPVEFPPGMMTRAGQGHGNPHGAIGVIRYSAMDGKDAPDGTILYLKATLSGDETIDVRNFATTNASFPHESTADQFFDEAQFESYRALGFHTVLSVAPNFRGDVKGLCDAARQTLTPAATR